MRKYIKTVCSIVVNRADDFTVGLQHFDGMYSKEL